MFERFTFWLQTDPKSRVKILFWVGVSTFLVILISGLYYLYSQPAAKDTNSQNITNSSSSLGPKFSFGNSSALLKVDNERILAPNKIYFSPYSADYISFSSELKLKYNGKLLADSSTLIPNTVSFYPDGATINEDGGSTIFYQSNSQLRSLNPDFRYVTFFQSQKRINSSTEDESITGFISISKKGNSINQNFARSIDTLENSTLYSTILPKISFENYELRNFNELPYTFVYQKYNRKGRVEIWKSSQEDSRLILTIENLLDTKYSYNKLLFLDGDNLKLIDFTSANPVIIDLTYSKQLLLSNQLKGQISPGRCTLFQNSTKIRCLVKQNTDDSTNPKEQDQIVDYDYAKKLLEITNKNLVVSGLAIYFDSTDKLYIVGQQDGILYQLKN
ncbi:MAG: hypothetical protein WCK98_02930 [bacterium]